jgi:predicted dehydrogenase
MSQPVDRRGFLGTSIVAGSLVAAGSLAYAQKESANERIRIGVMGVNGRGSALARGFASQPNCEIAYICDVDNRAIGKAVNLLKGRPAPKTTADFRNILDDKEVDVLICAAPNNWHAPATIMACKAGKHVYVEKPCSHTAEEGELALQAARKYNRVVTMGTQRRSWPAIREGIQKIHEGELGKVRYARTWYNNRRGSIGTGKQSAAPDWLDFNLWQGPATDQPFKDNIVHYNWHWHWHWGNGELGNNGIHALDVARWGLQVEFPKRVVSAGGRYRYDDDQETPDTQNVAFEFDDCQISWEGLSCSPLGFENSMFGISFHGDEGSLVIDGGGWRTYDMRNKETGKNSGGGGDATHQANFLDCIRNGGTPNADIQEAHRSTLLCHLGNISQRSGRALTTDPKNGHILGDEKAAGMWGREYRKEYEHLREA